MKALKERGLSLRTNTTLLASTINDAEDLIKDVGDYVEEMTFFHMRPLGRGKGLIDQRVGFKELNEFNEKMELLSKKYSHIRFNFKEKVSKENLIAPSDLGLRIGTPDGLTRLELLADGSLWVGYTVYIDQKWKSGNLKEENYSLLKIWRYSSVLGKYRNLSRKLMERCLTCSEFNKKCPGVNVEIELLREKYPELGNPNCIY